MTVNSSSTQPNKAADYWDQIYAQTGSQAMADKATTQKYGPPPVQSVPSPTPQPADAAKQRGAPPAYTGSYGIVDAAANGLMGGSLPSIQGANQGLAGLGLNPGEDLSTSLADQSATAPFPSPSLPGISAAMDQGVAGQQAEQGAYAASNPIPNFVGEAIGGVLGGKALAGSISATAKGLVQLVGLKPQWAQRVAPYLVSSGVGATQGAMRAAPGERGKDALEGAGWGLGLTAAVDMATHAWPIIKYLAGSEGPAKRETVTNYLALDYLARTNQTVKDAMDRAEKLLEVTGKMPTVAEAMGPAGQPLIAKHVTQLSPEVGGQASAAASLLDAASPVQPSNLPQAVTPPSPPPMISPQAPVVSPAIAGALKQLGYKPEDLARIATTQPQLLAALEKAAASGGVVTLPEGMRGPGPKGPGNSFAPPPGTPPDQVEAALRASLAKGNAAFMDPSRVGTPFNPAETQIATKAAIQMGLAPKDATVTVELAKEINAARSALASTLHDVALREPGQFDDLVQRMGNSMSMRPVAYEKFLALFTKLQQSKTLRAETLLQTMLRDDPIAFFSNLPTLRANEAGRKTISRVLTGAAVGVAGGRYASPAGITYEPK